MGYCILLTGCAACSSIFGANPSFVPSLRVNGVKQPICRSCFDKWNAYHRPNDPLELHPQAYEPLPEEQLGDTSAQNDPRYRGDSYTNPPKNDQQDQG